MANEAFSWDVLRKAKVLTLLEASYICCGLPPVTDDECRLTKTAHGANVESMARRLMAEVPHKGVRRRGGQTIFQSAAVKTFAKLNGFRLPWEASAASPPSSATPTETALIIVAGLTLLLAEKSGRYRRGTKPNASQIAEAVQDILAELPDVKRRGLSSTSIRGLISAGLSLLATDGKTGKTPRPFISD